MTNYYFDPSGVDTSNIITGDTILDTDVKVPIEALKSAIQDMDTNLYNAFGNKAYDFASIGPASTTSTSYVEIPNAEVTVEMNGGDIQILLLGSFSSPNSELQLNFSLDGTLMGGAGIGRQVNTGTEIIVIYHVFRNLSAGSHTVKAHWNTTGTAYVSQYGPWARLWAQEK
ncbi:MAG: hypothetical protein KC708_17150 [Anaerolineae bacterium]|nr:hypothetical protein [Anaerolineae bacterium]